MLDATVWSVLTTTSTSVIGGRKPPLQLRVTKKLRDPLVLDQMHPLPAHARDRDCALHHPVGTGRLAGHASASRTLDQVRQEGVELATHDLNSTDPKLSAISGTLEPDTESCWEPIGINDE